MIFFQFEEICFQVASYNGILEFAFKFEVNCSAVEEDPSSYIGNDDVILEVTVRRLEVYCRSRSVMTFSVDVMVN